MGFPEPTEWGGRRPGEPLYRPFRGHDPFAAPVATPERKGGMNGAEYGLAAIIHTLCAEKLSESNYP